MRMIDTTEIYKAIKELASRTVVNVNADAIKLLEKALENEKGENAKFALEMILENDLLAAQKRIPACQDTGLAVVFLEIGQDVLLAGEYVNDMVNRAVEEAYAENCFRKSAAHPLTRVNTNTNAPAVIHTEIVKGNKVTVKFLAKGFGSENMSRLYMLTPSDGTDGIKKAVAETVKQAGANACPPLFIGLGVGGTMEKAAFLSKKALMRSPGESSLDPAAAQLEKELLTLINETGVGVQGFGGNNTALSVAVEIFPTHIAGLPVAVNLQCHAVRHSCIIL